MNKNIQTQWITPIPQMHLLHPAPKIMVALNDIVFKDDDGSLNTSKRGLPSDGVTMPYFLDPIWPPFDPKYLRSVLQHDNQYVLHHLDYQFMQTRKMVDSRFLRSLRCEKFNNAGLWYFFVEMLGQRVWDRPDTDPDDNAWFVAMKAGDLALDEWIRKITENPRLLEKVKYATSLTKDSRSLQNDFKNLAYKLT